MYKKIYKKMGMEKYLDGFFSHIKNQRTRVVDLITANGQAYLVAGNMGIDARIVKNAIDYKEKFGSNAYLAAAYKSIVKHENIPLEIAVDGQALPVQDYTLVAICNNNTYGGGLPIAPMAQFDDGEITLCLVRGMSRAKLGVLFPSLLVKKHVHIKDITFINCHSVEIKPATTPLQKPGPITLCLDGNLEEVEGLLAFKILPKALEVFG